MPFKDYAYNELRYSSLARTMPEEAASLLVDAQAAVIEKYMQYEDARRARRLPLPSRRRDWSATRQIGAARWI